MTKSPLVKRMIYGASAIDVFRKLVKMGEAETSCRLPEEVEYYLVRLFLVSFRINDPREVPERRLATIYADVRESKDTVTQLHYLHELGFEGLKLLGFFPEAIVHRNVSESYIFAMTAAAYESIAAIDTKRVKGNSFLRFLVPTSRQLVTCLPEAVLVLRQTRAVGG